MSDAELIDLCQKIIELLAKNLLIDLENDNLDCNDYDESNEKHQKYFHFRDWMYIITILANQRKYRTLKILLGFLKRKELRPKRKPLLNFLIKRAVEAELARFENKGIILTEKQLTILEKLSKATHSKQHHIERARIILFCAENLNDSKIAEQLGCHRKTVAKWRKRWIDAMPILYETEEEHPHQLKRMIHSVLEDAYRCGAPPKITPEQVAQIITIACRSPKEFEIDHLDSWTNKELAKYLVEQGIVENISVSSVNRLLNQFGIRPHLIEYYLNPDIQDEEEFNEKVRKLCMLYKNAAELQQYNIEVICVDEMTGIQALTHNHPAQPTKPGKKMRVETKYQRQGTTGILGARCVASGLITAIIQKERKEEDFVSLIKYVMEAVPAKKFIFVADNLNTHKSESLVKLAAQEEGIDINTLGKKNSSGILKSMKTREEFLTDLNRKRIQFFYIPKNCSWLNQIEIWFSIIKRRILTRKSSYKSVAELEARIARFIEYYNKELAEPFKWEYGGHFKASG